MGFAVAKCVLPFIGQAVFITGFVELKSDLGVKRILVQ